MRYIPLSIKGLLWGLTISLLMWLVLDAFQTRALTELLDKELQKRLRDELVTARTRFHEHIMDQVELTEQLSSDPRYLQHVSEHLRLHPDAEHTEVYPGIPENWKLPEALWMRRITPDYILSLDNNFHTIELVNMRAGHIPDEIRTINPFILELADQDAFIHAVGDDIYLFSSWTLANAEGVILLVSKIDSNFLLKSQQYVLLRKRLLVLFSGTGHKMLASTEKIRQQNIDTDFIKGGSSFFDYGSSDVRLELSLFLPKDISRQLSHDILQLTGQQRLYAVGAVLLFFFVWVQYYASMISRLARHVAGMAKNIFDSDEYHRESLDEISYLKSVFANFSRQLKSQKRLDKEKQELEKERLQLDILNSLTRKLQIGLLVRHDQILEPMNDVMRQLLSDCGALMQIVEQDGFDDYQMLDCDGIRHIFEIKSIQIGRNQQAVLVQDVTLIRSQAEELEYIARHDTLTRLPNRFSFEQSLKSLLDETADQKQQHILAFMDLDQFKVVNDTCGHAAGDLLLKQLSQLLSRQIRQSDILARLGGDEFGLILPYCSRQKAEEIAENIIDKVLAFRFVWDDQVFNVGMSIGMAAFGSGNESSSHIMSQADTACYLAKESGGNHFCFTQPGDAELTFNAEAMDWVSRLRKGFDEQRFVLDVQPVRGLGKSGNTSVYEVLLRLRDDDGQLIPASAFISAAERHKLVEQLDRLVIAEVVEWLQNNREQHPDILLSVNLSGKSLGSADFQSFLHEILAEQTDWHHLCVEITETSVVRDVNRSIEFINFLKNKGCSLALDDFGSGLSSFAYLKQFPVDYLKIDGMFVKNLEVNPEDEAFIRSMADMGHCLNMKIIAEGVESEAVFPVLEALGVDFVQGYAIRKPFPLAEL